MIRALVVDDEAPARGKIRQLLASEQDLEVVAEAADGPAAVEAIRHHRPDLVFLDVQMPRLDGFGVIEAVGVEAMPLTVFVTAYDEHALRAFEVHAFDYLLKPFAARRFRRVLDRVRARLADRSSADAAQRLHELLASATGGGGRYLRRILVQKEEDREILLPVERIELVRSERNYLRFYAADGDFVRRGTLTELAEQLDPEQFLRINRSEIVRLDAIAELQPWFHGDYRVLMTGGETLTWSRRFRAKARDRF